MPFRKLSDYPVDAIVVNMPQRGRKRAAVTESVAPPLEKSSSEVDELFELRASNLALQKQLAISLDDERRTRSERREVMPTFTSVVPQPPNFGFGGFGGSPARALRQTMPQVLLSFLFVLCICVYFIFCCSYFLGSYAERFPTVTSLRRDIKLSHASHVLETCLNVIEAKPQLKNRTKMKHKPVGMSEFATKQRARMLCWCCREPCDRGVVRCCSREFSFQQSKIAYLKFLCWSFTFSLLNARVRMRDVWLKICTRFFTFSLL